MIHGDLYVLFICLSPVPDKSRDPKNNDWVKEQMKEGTGKLVSNEQWYKGDWVSKDEAFSLPTREFFPVIYQFSW